MGGRYEALAVSPEPGPAPRGHHQRSGAGLVLRGLLRNDRAAPVVAGPLCRGRHCYRPGACLAGSWRLIGGLYRRHWFGFPIPEVSVCCGLFSLAGYGRSPATASTKVSRLTRSWLTQFPRVVS